MEIKKQQIAIVGRILAAAFHRYPLMMYAFAGLRDEERARRLQCLYTRCTQAATLYGGGVLAEKQEGAAIWLHPDHFQLSLPEELKSGMAWLPLELGIRPTLRLVRHDGESEGWIKQYAPASIGYLWCIGVPPEMQGRGIGRWLINECTTQMRAAGLSECWLKTEDPKNVAIYQKLGFEMMRMMTVKSSGIPSWAMRRVIDRG
jgi:ribosomal protein S18 acetylase RimI-like enzyme